MQKFSTHSFLWVNFLHFFQRVQNQHPILHFMICTHIKILQIIFFLLILALLAYFNLISAEQGCMQPCFVWGLISLKLYDRKIWKNSSYTTWVFWLFYFIQTKMQNLPFLSKIHFKKCFHWKKRQCVIKQGFLTYWPALAPYKKMLLYM